MAFLGCCRLSSLQRSPVQSHTPGMTGGALGCGILPLEFSRCVLIVFPF